MFGRAVVAALRGGASSPLSSTVTAEMLFTSIVKHMKQYLCESVHQFDYQNNCENYEVPDLNESISSSGDLENGNYLQFQIIGKDDWSQMTANNEGSTSYLNDKYGNKKTTADTMTINQNPIMVVPRIPRSGISFRICGTHHTRQLSSVSVMNIVTYSCSPPPAPKKPEVSFHTLV